MTIDMDVLAWADTNWPWYHSDLLDSMDSWQLMARLIGPVPDLPVHAAVWHVPESERLASLKRGHTATRGVHSRPTPDNDFDY